MFNTRSPPQPCTLNFSNEHTSFIHQREKEMKKPRLAGLLGCFVYVIERLKTHSWRRGRL